MRRFRFSVASITLVLLAAACSSERQIISTPTSPAQQVVDSSPYVCDFIPERAFRLITGVIGPLKERTNGTESNGDCRAPDTIPQPLEVWWREEGPGMPSAHLSSLSEGRRNIYTRHGGLTLPTDLGDGMAAYLTNGLLATQPYRVSANFRCDSKERMLDIYLAQVAKGRDALKDLIDLMRIAQKRYGELHNCTPGT